MKTSQGYLNLRDPPVLTVSAWSRSSTLPKAAPSTGSKQPSESQIPSTQPRIDDD